MQMFLFEKNSGKVFSFFSQKYEKLTARSGLGKGGGKYQEYKNLTKKIRKENQPERERGWREKDNRKKRQRKKKKSYRVTEEKVTRKKGERREEEMKNKLVRG